MTSITAIADPNSGNITVDGVPVERDEPKQTAAPETPEVPEKFLGEDGQPDVAKLLRSYGELEKAFSKKGAKDTPEVTPEVTPEEKPVEKPVESLKIEPTPIPEFTFDQLVDKRFSGTDLSDEESKWLESKGIPASALDGAVVAKRSDAASANEELVSVIGGPSEYQEVAKWAKANVPEETLAQFNQLAADPVGNKAALQLALVGLKAQKDAYTSTPTFGGGAGTSPNAGFKSQEEVNAAIRDPKYKTDPAYRDQVTAKIKASNF